MDEFIGPAEVLLFLFVFDGEVKTPEDYYLMDFECFFLLVQMIFQYWICITPLL